MSNEHHIQFSGEAHAPLCTGAADTRTTKTQALGVETSFGGLAFGRPVGVLV
jgi:hypothetical protein